MISFELMSFSSRKAAYSVVVLPEPVGPVQTTTPLGLWISWRIVVRSSSRNPSLSRSSCTLLRSRTRMTTLSPNMVGSTLTRKSIGWLLTDNSMRPSCGMRRSAMSRFAMTLMRELIAGAM